MNLEDAKAQAKIIFKSDLDFENSGGVKQILRKPAEGEELKPGPTPDTVECRDGIKAMRKDGRILLGAGNSWLTAMKQATKKRAEEMRDQEDLRRTQQREDERSAQVHFNKFMEFLQEKFGPEFEVYLGKDATQASPPVP